MNLDTSHSVPVPERVTYPHFDILLFGGSFDPPHQSHLDTIQYVRKRFSPKFFDVLPTPVNPLKANKAIDIDYRIGMLLGSLRDAGLDPYVNISLADKSGKTIDTIKTYKELHPEKTIGIVCGEDILKQFCQWQDWQLLLEYASLVIAPRYGKTVDQVKSELDPRLRPYEHKIIILEPDEKEPLGTMSSTQIRLDLTKNASLAGLTPTTSSLIQENELYKRDR